MWFITFIFTVPSCVLACFTLKAQIEANVQSMATAKERKESRFLNPTMRCKSRKSDRPWLITTA